MVGPAELSADHVLQHLTAQSEISNQLAQLRVLVLELLQPAHLGRQQPLVLLLPIEVSRQADPRSPAASSLVIDGVPRPIGGSFSIPYGANVVVTYSSPPTWIWAFN